MGYTNTNPVGDLSTTNSTGGYLPSNTGGYLPTNTGGYLPTNPVATFLPTLLETFPQPKALWETFLPLLPTLWGTFPQPSTTLRVAMPL